jgi:hypothetical protein
VVVKKVRGYCDQAKENDGKKRCANANDQSDAGQQPNSPVDGEVAKR